MIETMLLANALRLPREDVEALTQGRMITALPWTFISPGQSFALYPDSPEISQEVRFWAKCELCKSIDNPMLLVILSKHTIWAVETLEYQFARRDFLLLAYFRVYKMEEPIFIGTKNQSIFLTLTEPIMVSNLWPILDDSIFNKRKKQLENWESPPYPELEALQGQVAQLACINSAARIFDDEIRVFLGWKTISSYHKNNFNLDWVQSINELATRSQEQDDGRKSNYQAGTDFENVVRKSLEFLGFKVEDAYNGGAGGLDLYCSQPYDVVGECKAGKTIPDRSVEELDRIGKRHLQDAYLNAARLIIGPGKPSPNLQQSAIISKTSIINAMSLQKLVELQAKYPGSVNLIELKKVIKPGQTDDKIDKYVEEVLQQLRLRSYIIQLVKKYQDSTKDEEVEIGIIFGAYINSSSPYSLKQIELKEIMIELASPLVGYLGRVKGTDRFYFLREFLIQ